MAYSIRFLFLSAILFSAVSCAKDFAFHPDTEGEFGTLKVTGCVVAEYSSGQVPLDGMMVVVDYGDRNQDTVYTSGGGYYVSELVTMNYADKRKITVTVSDVDGDRNGYFADESKYIDHSSSSGFEGGNGSGFAGTKVFKLDFLLVPSDIDPR